MNATVVYLLKYNREDSCVIFDIFDTSALAWEQHEKNREFAEDLFARPCVETWLVQKELR